MDLVLEAEAVEDRERLLVELDLGLGIRDEAVDEVLDALVDVLVVGDDALRVGAREIAHDAQRQIVLRVEDRRRGLVGVALLDRGPDGREVADVGLEVGLAHAIAGRADDEAELRRPQALDDLAQSSSFLVGSDPARHTDAPRPGRQHEVPAGNRDVRRDARALRPDRLLRDLDDDLLTLVEDRVDARRGRAAAAASASASPTASAALAVVAGLEGALEVVADVEEGRFFEADVDEGGLHAGEDARDAPLHDVADDALVALAFDVELGELSVLEQRNPGLPELRIDDDFVLHRSACSVPALRRITRAGVMRTKDMRRTGSREADRSWRSLCREGRNGLAWPGMRLAPGSNRDRASRSLAGVLRGRACWAHREKRVWTG